MAKDTIKGEGLVTKQQGVKDRKVLGEAILIAHEPEQKHRMKCYVGTLTIPAEGQDIQLSYGDEMVMNHSEYERLRNSKSKLLPEGYLVEIDEAGNRVKGVYDTVDIRTDEELKELLKSHFNHLQKVVNEMMSPHTLNRLSKLAKTQDVTMNVLSLVESRFNAVVASTYPFDDIIPSARKRRIDKEQDGRAEIPHDFKERPRHTDDIYVKEEEPTPVE